ncbi:MAG: hypothetical protein JJE37_05430 [Methyloceanibacter sp.]|jgi:hypothetical protein|nr:hypothetical protein [Methyloceanibacter sp.]
MTNGSNLVTIRDIDVPFWRIVLILVKWSIASIPALIIFGLLWVVIGWLLALVFSVPVPPVPPSP